MTSAAVSTNKPRFSQQFREQKRISFPINKVTLMLCTMTSNSRETKPYFSL
jgi:hypothetical protein